VLIVGGRGPADSQPLPLYQRKAEKENPGRLIEGKKNVIVGGGRSGMGPPIVVYLKKWNGAANNSYLPNHV